MIHFLNRAIEMEVGSMLQEFIGSEGQQIGGTPDTGESQVERHLRKRSMIDTWKRRLCLRIEIDPDGTLSICSR
jgi:hypothetical protein